MPIKRASEFNETTTVNSTDYVLIVQNGETKKIRATTLKGTDLSIINDLNTGGSNNGLSAQQGVVLNNKIESVRNRVEAIENKIEGGQLDQYEHPDTHPASMISGLSPVAVSGLFTDLLDKALIEDKIEALKVTRADMESMITDMNDKNMEMRNILDTLAKNISDIMKRLEDTPDIPLPDPEPEPEPPAEIPNVVDKNLVLWLDSVRNVNNGTNKWGDVRDNNKIVNLIFGKYGEFKDGYFQNNGTGYAVYNSNVLSAFTENVTITFCGSIKQFCPNSCLLSFGEDENRLRLREGKSGRIELLGHDKTINDAYINLPLAQDVELTFVMTKTKLELYMNGLLYKTENLDSSIATSDLYSSTMYILSEDQELNMSNVKMKYLLIYNRALDADEILANFDAINPNGIPDIVLPAPSPEDDRDKLYNLDFFEYDNEDRTYGLGTYYISPNGHDGNTGLSIDKPIKTIARFKEIISSSNAGYGLLYFVDGEYSPEDINKLNEPIYNRNNKLIDIRYQGIGNRAIVKSCIKISGESIANTVSTTFVPGKAIYAYKNESLVIENKAFGYEDLPILVCNNKPLDLSSLPKKDAISSTTRRITNTLSNTRAGEYTYQIPINSQDSKYLSNYGVRTHAFDNALVMMNKDVDVPVSHRMPLKVTRLMNDILTCTGICLNKGNIVYASDENYGGAYKIFNMPTLIDYGEYAIDFSTGTIYICPPEGMNIRDCEFELYTKNTSKNNILVSNGDDSYYADTLTSVLFDSSSTTISRINFFGCSLGKDQPDDIIGNLTLDKCIFRYNIDKFISLYSFPYNITINNCKMGDCNTGAIALYKNKRYLRKELPSDGSYKGSIQPPYYMYPDNIPPSVSGNNLMIKDCIFVNTNKFTLANKVEILTDDTVKTYDPYDYQLNYKPRITHNTAIYVATNGTTIKNCTFYNCRATSIKTMTNNCTIIGNEFNKCNTDVIYGGVIEATQFPLQVNNQILSNKFILSSSQHRFIRHRSAIMLRDLASCVTVSDNVIDGFDTGVYIDGGSDNKISQNSIYRCINAVYGASTGLNGTQTNPLTRYQRLYTFGEYDIYRDQTANNATLLWSIEKPWASPIRYQYMCMHTGTTHFSPYWKVSSRARNSIVLLESEGDPRTLNDLYYATAPEVALMNKNVVNRYFRQHGTYNEDITDNTETRLPYIVESEYPNLDHDYNASWAYSALYDIKTVFPTNNSVTNNKLIDNGNNNSIENTISKTSVYPDFPGPVIPAGKRSMYYTGTFLNNDKNQIGASIDYSA